MNTDSLPTTPNPNLKPEQVRVLVQATDAVNEMLQGKLWLHVKTGGVYLEYDRGDTVFDEKAGGKLFGGRMCGPLIEATDDIEAGEEFVRYRNVLTGEGWARPARLFDDGRFIPLVLAPAAHAEALERETALLEGLTALKKKWEDEYDSHGPEHDYEEAGGVLIGKGAAADELGELLAAQAPASAEGGAE